MMIARTIRRFVGPALMGAALVSSISCGEVARTGRSPVFIVIDSIQAASGAEPEAFGSILFSDVETLVEATINGQAVRVPTIFADPAEATFRIEVKNPG